MENKLWNFLVVFWFIVVPVFGIAAGAVDYYVNSCK